MGVLRKTVQREILDILDDSVFTSNDFDVKFGDPEKNEAIVHVSFIHAKEYFYILQRNQGPFGWEGWLVIKSPGVLEDNENVVYQSIKDAFIDIGPWCQEIRYELKSVHPIYEEVDNLKKLILEHIKGDENEEFSVKEIYDIKEKFLHLQQRVEKLENDKIITEKQLEEFKNGIIQVTEDIEHYPKKTWVNTATNKLINIISSIGKSKEGRQVLAEGAKKLLGME